MPDDRRSRVIGGVLVAALVTYGLLTKQPVRSPQIGGRLNDRHDSAGRYAKTPSDIPALGWRDIAMRIISDISTENLMLIAAGTAFYALLAIPSAITAIVSLYGLMLDPGTIGSQVESLRGILPQEAIGLLTEQLKNLTAHSGSTLSVGFATSLVLALWSSRSATASMVSALNIAYNEPEKRNFIWFQVIAIGLTVGLVIFIIIALALVAVLPIVIEFLPLGTFGKTLASVIRWPILIVMVMLGLSAIYRFAPSRREPKWRWVTWGAAIATVLWVLASALFSIYVAQFASYDKSYGSIGGVVVLLMWLFLSSFIVLLGAEINAEIEHQTKQDSTTGQPKPLGKRGAQMADTVGEGH